VTERPQPLDPAWRKFVDTEPIEKQMGRAGSRAHRGDARDRTIRESRSRRPEDRDEGDGADAVRHRPMCGEQQIEIRRRTEHGAGQRQSVPGAPIQRGRCRRGPPVAVAGHEIGDPGGGEPGERMANWARHAALMMADSATAGAKRRK